MAKFEQENLGRYKLLALLATGGMAEIFLARQTGIQGFERLVVVKRILPHLAREKRFLDMFFDEARIAAQLNHPNIVQIFDLGQEGSHYFIAMEYLEGESLAYLVREAKKNGQNLPAQLAAGIMAQVCDGLGHAHKLCDDVGQPMHIVHRDVSPQNIIVMFSGRVKLVDFGIAKAASQAHQTRVGTLKGKLSYMSPEQCRSQQIDAASDVFSLGIVFWELLARNRLFKHDDEVAIIQAVVSEPIPPVRQLRPEVPPELEAIVSKALQRNPTQRYSTAAEMGAAIREYLRRSGAASGPEEIAVFVEEVFGDRARTKRRLLEDIRRDDGRQISLGVLKPDTEESLPSGSGNREAVPEDLREAPTKSMVSEEVLASGGAQRRKLSGMWLLPPAGLVVGALLWWLVSGGRTVDTPSPSDAGLVIAGSGNRVVTAPDAGSLQETALAQANDPGTAEPRPARLSIRSDPSACMIEVDGVEVPGETPIDAVEVDAQKEHTIEVLCPKHEKELKKVTPRPGELVSLSFAPARAKTAAVTLAAAGMLRLDSEPWSEVYLGKKKLGITPLLGVKLPAGKYTLTMVNEERGLKKTIQVTIEGGKTTTLWQQLNK